MPTAKHAEQLAGMFQAGRHFQFLRESHDLLNKLPHAPDIAALSVQALVKLGYGGPARELIQARADIGGPIGQRGQLNDSLQTLPNGRIAWNALNQNYDKSLQAFLKRYPHYEADLLAAQNELKKIHLFKSSCGRLHMSRRQPGCVREWISDLGIEPHEFGLKLPEQGPIHVPVVVGVSLGALLRKICDLTCGAFLNYNHPVFVIEPDLKKFVAWMHGADQSELLAHSHMEWFIGPDAVAKLNRHLRENDPVVLPQLVLNQSDDIGLTAEIQNDVVAIQAARDDELKELTDRLEAHYRSASLSEQAQRLKPPGRVLALTSRFTTMLQYSTRDALDALDHMGYETRLLIEEFDHHCLEPNAICKTIDAFKPDLLIILDHMRREYPFLPSRLPMLTWIQDPMPELLCKEAGQSVTTSDFVCGLFRPRCIEQFDYPPDQFEYVDVPVSTRVFHDGAASDKQLARFTCDVSFVSNASMPIEAFHEIEKTKNDSSVHGFMDVLFESAKTAIDDDSFCQKKAVDLTSDVAQSLKLDFTVESIRNFATHYTYRVFDWGRRQRTLEWVSNWAQRTGRTFRIFGKGWEDHPTLSAHAAGVVEHGQDLCAVYHSSTLSLQLIPSGFHHQRSFEIIASGSLPLTRYCEGDFGDLPASEFERLRANGRSPEVIPDFPNFREIVFTSAEDFEGRAESFLASIEQRSAMLKDLQACVHERFTYDAVLSRVLKSFREHLNRQA